MTLIHKNPNITTKVVVDKIQYRDAKRIKLKLSLFTCNWEVIELRCNYTVKPDWFNNFCSVGEVPVLKEDCLELLAIDNWKDWNL